MTDVISLGLPESPRVRDERDRSQIEATFSILYLVVKVTVLLFLLDNQLRNGEGKSYVKMRIPEGRSLGASLEHWLPFSFKKPNAII